LLLSPGKNCYRQGQQDVDRRVKPTSKYSSVSFTVNRPKQHRNPDHISAGQSGFEITAVAPALPATPGGGNSCTILEAIEPHLETTGTRANSEVSP
jgi:hypothetical protein